MFSHCWISLIPELILEDVNSISPAFVENDYGLKWLIGLARMVSSAERLWNFERPYAHLSMNYINNDETRIDLWGTAGIDVMTSVLSHRNRQGNFETNQRMCRLNSNINFLGGILWLSQSNAFDESRIHEIMERPLNSLARLTSLCGFISLLLQRILWSTRVLLTYWERDKMTAISQTTFSNAFFGMKMFDFRLKLLCNLLWN